jgi:hypothetical protein
MDSKAGNDLIFELGRQNLCWLQYLLINCIELLIRASDVTSLTTSRLIFK